jgi:hypothetical protein
MSDLIDDKLYSSREVRALLGGKGRDGMLGNSKYHELKNAGKLETVKLGGTNRHPGRSIRALIEGLPRCSPRAA